MIGDDPFAVVRAPAGEPYGDTRGDAEHPQHSGHRAREVLAVPGPRASDEREERRAVDARRGLVVRESPGLPEPRLEREDRPIGRLGLPGNAPGDVVHPSMPDEARVRRIGEEVAHNPLPALGPERREQTAVDLPEPCRGRWEPDRCLRERTRSGIRGIAPDAVAPAFGNRPVGAEDAAREQEHGAEPARIERDGRARGDEMVVHAAPRPPRAARATRSGRRARCGTSCGSWSKRAS